jgi:stage II sporulation protein E
LEFIKIGAANSYLKTGQVVEKISSTSLPAGILREVEADCDLKYAADGDFVIMVTDGITDVLERSQESSLKKIIQAYEGTTPQDLADRILYRALRESGGKPKDDMTVLVAKMIEN